MNIDQYINRFSGWLFGHIPGDGSERFHFHSQNLNEDRRGNVKGWPYHGRCWLRTQWFTSKFSWNLWTHFCGFDFRYDNEDGFHWHIAFPPFSFWFSIGGMRKFRDWWSSRPWLKSWNEKFGGFPDSHRYTDFDFISFSIFDWSLHWKFLKFDWGWSATMPKWMDGHWNILDKILGGSKYSKELISTHDVIIPMPEGGYPAVVKIERCTWKRPRWFAKVIEDASIDIPWGIPHQGKGENSWDCGEDRLYGCGSRSTSLSKVIGDVVAAALRGREKYDGKGVKAVYPPPGPPTPPPAADPGPVAEAR